MSVTQVNGPVRFIDTIDTSDPDYMRMMMRPAEVKEDITQMDNRSRVSQILNSQSFRTELEQIIDSQLQSGYPDRLLDKNITFASNNLQLKGNGIRVSPVIPINDIRGVNASKYNKPERLNRCKLAALYRIMDLNGWSNGLHNTITTRLDDEQDHFLVAPYGLLCNEVTASNLVKVNRLGENIGEKSTAYGIDNPAFSLNSAIHSINPDIKCIIQLRSSSVVAISAMKPGLMPLSQDSMSLGRISYYDYNGLTLTLDDCNNLVNSFDSKNKVLFLRNHGAAICGNTIEEAAFAASIIVSSCDNQLSMLTVALSKLIFPSAELQEKVYKVGFTGGGGVDTGGLTWNVGEMEFEAQMRQLDDAGYRTGYAYRIPPSRLSRRDRSQSEIEPPTSHDDNTTLKAAQERQKRQQKIGWLNRSLAPSDRDVTDDSFHSISYSVGRSAPDTAIDERSELDQPTTLTENDVIAAEEPPTVNGPDGRDGGPVVTKMKRSHEYHVDHETDIDAVNTEMYQGNNTVEQQRLVEIGDTKETAIDDVVSDELPAEGTDDTDMAISAEMHPRKETTVSRAESARHPQRNKELIHELEGRQVKRSLSERRDGPPTAPKPTSPKPVVDETKDENSVKSETKGKKEKSKKKVFHMPSFSKKKKNI